MWMRSFFEKKCLDGIMADLLGYFEENGVFCVVFCGEVVVRCVANVV
jgi:hypothetical protein